MLYRIIRSWYTGCWWVGCYIWYSEEGPGQAAVPPSLLLAVLNTAHPSTASVPITVLLYDGPLLFGFNMAIKGSIAYPEHAEKIRLERGIRTTLRCLESINWARIRLSCCNDRGYWSRTLKKYSTSRIASSGMSVQCIAFFAFVRPNSARMEFGRICLASSCITVNIKPRCDDCTL